MLHQGPVARSRACVGYQPRRCCHASNTVASAAASAASSHTRREQQLRLLLGRQFPNALLLEGDRLPSLHNSKHFVNLTNGLEMAPLLQQLQLPFSVVRIRSTSLEQQSFESLMLELDANLLLSLALGHSCIVWDCGCRNRTNGAPRALWYGLEFIRFALQRFWLGAGGPAHLRGHNVSDTFELACRKFHPSTKKRIRYYQRFVTPQVQQRGVLLTGMFKRTERDEDVEFFVDKAWQHCGTAAMVAHPAAVVASQQQVPVHSGAVFCQASAGKSADLHAGGAEAETAAAAGFEHSQLSVAELDAYSLLLSEGVGMFTAGLSHQQFLDLQSVLTTCKP